MEVITAIVFYTAVMLNCNGVFKGHTQEYDNQAFMEMHYQRSKILKKVKYNGEICSIIDQWRGEKRTITNGKSTIVKWVGYTE